MNESLNFKSSFGVLSFDVIVDKETSNRLTFYFIANEQTKNEQILENEGIIRVVCDSDNMPNVFTIPSHDPKFKRELTVYIHDYIAHFEQKAIKGLR